MRVICIYILGEANKAENLEGLAEACLRLTPQVAIDKKFIFLEVGACKNLYSETSVQARIQILLKRFAMTARLAIADDIPTALALAQFQVASKEQLPVDALP